MKKSDMVIEKIKDIFKNDTSGHDFWHTMRVYKNAMLIAENEVCDMEIVKLGALLHDVDDTKLFNTEEYYNARKIMTDCGIDYETAEKVIEIISKVSFKGTGTSVPSTIEGKIVQDADRLDALGAIGIARAFAYGGSVGRCIYDPEIKPAENISDCTYKSNTDTTVNHFYEKLFLLKDLMNTDTARKIAIERDSFMREFIDKFMSEWDTNF